MKGVCLKTTTLIVLLVCPAGAAQAQSPGVEFKLEIRVCGEAKGTFVKGGACWLMDPLKKTSVYEYQACAGLVIDGSILIAGLEGSVMVCGTLTVPVELAGDRKAWMKVATDRLKAQLSDPAMRTAIRQALGKDYSKVEVRQLREADSATARRNREVIRAAKKK